MQLESGMLVIFAPGPYVCGPVFAFVRVLALLFLHACGILIYFFISPRGRKGLGLSFLGPGLNRGRNG